VYVNIGVDKIISRFIWFYRLEKECIKIIGTLFITKIRWYWYNR